MANGRAVLCTTLKEQQTVGMVTGACDGDIPPDRAHAQITSTISSIPRNH